MLHDTIAHRDVRIKRERERERKKNKRERERVTCIHLCIGLPGVKAVTSVPRYRLYVVSCRVPIGSLVVPFWGLPYETIKELLRSLWL